MKEMLLLTPVCLTTTEYYDFSYLKRKNKHKTPRKNIAEKIAIFEAGFLTTTFQHSIRLLNYFKIIKHYSPTANCLSSWVRNKSIPEKFTENVHSTYRVCYLQESRSYITITTLTLCGFVGSLTHKHGQSLGSVQCKGQAPPSTQQHSLILVSGSQSNISQLRVDQPTQLKTQYAYIN
jgi:hypothetical protein